MDQIIRKFLTDSAEIKLALARDEAVVSQIVAASELLLKVVERGGTIYVCGNGGSACDGMHFVEELVARYKRERPGIKAQHLMDPAVLTCWGNDYSFESVFARQVQTLCNERDVLVVLSTSGNSKNILAAVKTAYEVGCPVIALSGRTGGALAKMPVEAMINIPADTTDRIQESHITLIHIFCEILETVEVGQNIASTHRVTVNDK